MWVKRGKNWEKLTSHARSVSSPGTLGPSVCSWKQSWTEWNLPILSRLLTCKSGAPVVWPARLVVWVLDVHAQIQTVCDGPSRSGWTRTPSRTWCRRRTCCCWRTSRRCAASSWRAASPPRTASASATSRSTTACTTCITWPPSTWRPTSGTSAAPRSSSSWVHRSWRRWFLSRS